jgi:hypothetical protein
MERSFDDDGWRKEGRMSNSQCPMIKSRGTSFSSFAVFACHELVEWRSSVSRRSVFAPKIHRGPDLFGAKTDVQIVLEYEGREDDEENIQCPIFNAQFSSTEEAA